MSYCRRNPGKSDVYMYAGKGGITCCGCDLSDFAIRWFPDAGEAVIHLREHLAAGHLVPNHAIRRLEQECLKTCTLCGTEFDPSQEDAQRRFSVICLACDLDYWAIEEEEWND